MIDVKTYLLEPSRTLDRSTMPHLRLRTKVAEAPLEPFMPGLRIRVNAAGAAVFKGGELVASYGRGGNLRVADAYKGRGIGPALSFIWWRRNPDFRPKRQVPRTPGGQKVSEKLYGMLVKAGDPRAAIHFLET